jgi:hypothetical protein
MDHAVVLFEGELRRRPVRSTDRIDLRHGRWAHLTTRVVAGRSETAPPRMPAASEAQLAGLVAGVFGASRGEADQHQLAIDDHGLGL